MCVCCVSVVYLHHKKGYKCYHPPIKQFYVTMDVTFFESEIYFLNPSSMGTNSTQDPSTSSLAPQIPTRSPSTPIVPTNDSILAGVLKFVMRKGINYLLVAIKENYQRDIHLIIPRHQSIILLIMFQLSNCSTL
ncbi:hypothetical protein CR513_59455, partial [Mucuna pruriens]